MSGSLFPRGVVVVGGLLAAASLGLAFALGLWGPTIAPPSAGNDAYSTSALGHRAFIELLSGLGVPVVVSRFDSAERTSEGGLLVVAEPRVDDLPSRARLREMIERAPRCLLVLPRRWGVPAGARSAWLQDAFEWPLDEVAVALDAAGLAGTLARVASGHVGAWRFADGLDARTPALSAPQLLQRPFDGLRPLVRCDAGVLVAERQVVAGEEERRLVVLTDPDLLANHGLAHGENAALLADLVASLVRPGEVVVVDETLHGHGLRPHLWREMLRFPLVMLLAQALLTVGALAWAASVRFGPPLPDPPAFQGGKELLVENTAQLLLVGRHAPAMLQRFRVAQLDAVARAFRLPAGLTRDEQERRLSHLARARGLTLPGSRAGEPTPGEGAPAAREDEHDRGPGHGRPLSASPRGAGEVLRAARRIHAWREAMLHGET